MKKILSIGGGMIIIVAAGAALVTSKNASWASLTSSSTPALTEPPSTGSNETTKNSSQEPFEKIISLGSGSLPLRSQHAVTGWKEDILTVFTDQNIIYVATSDGARYKVTTLGGAAGGPTIAASHDRIVIAWVTPTAIMASSSTDVKTWTPPVIVSTREKSGGPIPSIDWTGSTFVIAWVDAPRTNEATGGMDGVGDLRVATGDGIGAWNVSTLNSTTAIVAVSGSKIVWRDDRGIENNRTDSIRIADIDGKNEKTLTSGYDPAIAVDGEAIAIGYHLGSEAHLLTTTDGETWDDESLDSTGKFVAPLVSNGIFGAVWVDYTDKEAAKDARNDAGHRTTAIWNKKTYQMNEGETYTLQGQGTTANGIPVIVYQVDGKIYLTY